MGDMTCSIEFIDDPLIGKVVVDKGPACMYHTEEEYQLRFLTGTDFFLALVAGVPRTHKSSKLPEAPPALA